MFGKLSVLLATVPLGFNCGFISTSACESSTGVCSWGFPGGLASVPARTRWWLGQQEIWCSRRTWQPTPLFFFLEDPLDREAHRLWPTGSQRAGHGQRNSTHTHAGFFFFFSFPLATLSQWGSCMEGTVAWIKGTLAMPAIQGLQQFLSQEIWWHIRYGDTGDMVIGLFLACGSSAPVRTECEGAAVGVQGLWQHQGCRDTNCLSHRSSGITANRIFF